MSRVVDPDPSKTAFVVSRKHMADRDGEEVIKEQDRLLPIANISRIMKCALPDNAKIAKDAKETVQECVSEFVMFVTSEASDRCQQEKRKTINGEDLLWAMQSLGFDNYIEPLRIYLSKYRESTKSGSDRQPLDQPLFNYAGNAGLQGSFLQ